jgi:hypothetical protein
VTTILFRRKHRVSPVHAMDPHQGHRMSLFSKINNNQPDNSQKPLFNSSLQYPRHPEKQSTVSVFNNSLQRPFAPTRSSGLAENEIPRDLADSSLHLSGYKLKTSTPRGESRAPPGSPSSQHSSSFYDNKGGFLAMVRRTYS